MQKEIESIDQVLNNAQKPFTAIIGGAKVSSKISIIRELLDKIDNLIIGGGMIYTFIKAQGGEVGASLVEEDYLETAKEIIDMSDEKGVRILLPEDTLAADRFANDANIKTYPTHQIQEGWMGLDIGGLAIEHYAACIEESNTVLWNGPMGVFEMSSFETGTKSIANAVVKATERGAFSLVGGGDSVAAVNKFGIKDHLSYVSTGGGALLEYLEGKVRPGIQAMND
jgi:phosphoglycerate kinase